MSRSLLLVDPALFTAPYDRALGAALVERGDRVSWATRNTRAREDGLDAGGVEVEHLYYRGLEDTAKGRSVLRKARKLASHIIGSLRLVGLARRRRFDLVHFQWLVVPFIDIATLAALRRARPVVITVHDLNPFNDAPTSSLQRLGFSTALRLADHLIVHTPTAKAELIARGQAADTISVIPHGPLRLAGRHPRPRPVWTGAGRWKIVLFGRLQPYKGADTLIEALGRISESDRRRLQVIICGEPLMVTQPLLDRKETLGLGEALQFRFGRLDEGEMDVLFQDTDCFVFPYRQIDASGVLFTTLAYRRWMIASNLGAFRETLVDGVNGRQVPPGDVNALAAAMVDSIGKVWRAQAAPQSPDWPEIAEATETVYAKSLAAWRARRVA